MASFLETVRRFLPGKRTVESVQTAVTALKKRSVFLAAEVSRVTGDWVARLLPPNTENRFDLQLVRARSRSFCRNTPFGRKYLEVLSTNIVGAKGIQLEARVKNATLSDENPSQLNFEVNENIESAWREWGKSAGVDGMSFNDIEHLVLRTWAQDGEIFIRLITKDANNPFSFALQLIDADYLNLQMDSAQNSQTPNRIISGVEVDEYNRPLAYWFYKNHPFDATYNSTIGGQVRVPAEEVIHIKRADRPSQVRGIPPTAGTLYYSQMLNELLIANLVAVRVAASKQVFIKTDKENAAPYANLAYNPNGYQPMDVMEVSPGQMTRLDPGDEVEFFNPTNPGANFDSFVKSVTRFISSGLGITYSSLTNDLTSETYSSGRTALLTQQEYFRTLQKWFARSFHQRVYEEWLKRAILTSQLKLSAGQMAEYIDVEWHFPAQKFIDPHKELQAYQAAIDIGVASRTQIAGELGIDWEETFRNLANENKLADELGIDISGASKAERETLTDNDESTEMNNPTTDTPDEGQVSTEGEGDEPSPPPKPAKKGRGRPKKS